MGLQLRLHWEQMDLPANHPSMASAYGKAGSGRKEGMGGLAVVLGQHLLKSLPDVEAL